MSISVNDPYYKAEVTPGSIKTLGAELCAAYGQPATAFGHKGNTAHASGYHRSRAWVLHSPDSAYGSRDYSVQQSLDKQGDQNWVSAFDFTPGAWGTQENRRRMVEITSRVYNAAKARDARLANLREFAGTLDGRTVVTFYCADGVFKSPFDSSHLDHAHGSLWRAHAANDHTGILDVMLNRTKEKRPYMFVATDGTKYYWFNGVESRELPAAEVENAIYLAKQCGYVGQGPEWKNGVRTGWYPALFGPVRTPSTGGSVDQATVVAALRSPEGQAALVQAGNVAEDS